MQTEGVIVMQTEGLTATLEQSGSVKEQRERQRVA
jgi:hypothetical protein